MKTQIGLCAVAIALLSTSLAAALAPQTARADVTIPFGVSGTAEAFADQSCGGDCRFSGTLTIDVTTGAATAADITFPDLAAFDTLVRSDKSGTSHWFIGAFNSDGDSASLNFTTTPTPGSLVGFTGGSIILGVVEDHLYGDLQGTIGDVHIAAVPEASTWAMMALGFGLLGLVGYHKTRSEERSCRPLGSSR
jgi:hypothetical protein